MRGHVKIKAAGGRGEQRRTVSTASAASRHSLAAWIDAGDAAALSAASRVATPRVRDGLVLRKLSKGKSAERRVPDDSSSR